MEHENEQDEVRHELERHSFERTVELIFIVLLCKYRNLHDLEFDCACLNISYYTVVENFSLCFNEECLDSLIAFTTVILDE